MRRRGLSPTYLRSLLADTSWFLVVILIAIEALFVTDKILTDLLFVAIEHGLGAAFLMRAALLALPEILFLGVPLAVGIAVYFVYLQRREAGDFVILAQVGFAPVPMVGLALGTGAAALGLSIVIGGLLRPLAAHELAQSLHEARYAVLTTGQVGDRAIIQMDDVTIVFHRDPVPAGGARMFMHRQTSATQQQVITAQDSHVLFQTPEVDGRLTLSHAAITELHAPLAQGLGLGLTLSLAAERVQISGETLVIPAFRTRQSHTATMTLGELLAEGQARSKAAREAVLRIALGGVVSLLAPLIAACALGMTRGSLAIVAGPAGVALILAGGFSVAPLSVWLSAFELWQGLAVVVGVGLGLCLAAGAMMLWLGDALLTPAQIRL